MTQRIKAIKEPFLLSRKTFFNKVIEKTRKSSGKVEDHPTSLINFIPSNFFENYLELISFQWVKIEQHCQVKVHVHEVDTILISCSGKCLLVGDLEKVLQEGDIVFIPKYSKHGLSSYNNKLFWGISLKINNDALIP